VLHENVKRVNERYEEYDRLKSQFVGMVAHDFRRPLTVVRGFAELVLVDEPPDETVKEYMRGIVEECEALARLADDTLLLAKLETASVEFRWGQTDLGALLREVVPPSLAGHTVVLDVPAQLPEVVVDAQRLRQVLSNLVSNAIKYSPRGGKITLSCRVGDEVLIQVSDQGLGIPRGQQGQLFNKFERVQTEEHQAVSGTGLGLYICRLIVQGHGGRIWVESEPGRGSTFCVRIPRDARPGRGAPTPAPEETARDGLITSMFRPQSDLPAEYLDEPPARAADAAASTPGQPSTAAAEDHRPDDSQTALYRRAEARHSRRIRRMIPIRLNYQGATFTTYTAVINRRGALIICAAPVEPGTRLQITNLVTQETAPFEVVRRGDAEEGQYKLGVELIEELDFWGAMYDPDLDEEDFRAPGSSSRRGDS
jgi:two-component sensor histidine kinase